jgi:RES domain-containing protein
MQLRTVTCAGRCFRAVHPSWDDPLDGSYSDRSGARWNAPGDGSTLYFNRSVAVARMNVRRGMRGLPYGPEDIDPDAGHLLVAVDLPEGKYADLSSPEGLLAAGLPAGYPFDTAGVLVPHGACRPVGAAARASGLAGVVCRSAAPGAGPSDEELAYFGDPALLQVAEDYEFSDWYWKPRSRVVVPPGDDDQTARLR